MSITYTNKPLPFFSTCPRCLKDIPIKGDRWTGTQAMLGRDKKMAYTTVTFCGECYARIASISSIFEASREFHEKKTNPPSGDSEGTGERVYVSTSDARLPASLVGHT